MRTIEKYFELASKGGEVSIAEKTGNFHEFSDHDFGSKSSVGEKYNVPDFEFPAECRVCGDNPRINGSFYCPSCHPSRDEEGVSNDELVVGKYDYDYHSDKVRRNTNFDVSQTPDTVEKEEDDSVDGWVPYVGPQDGRGWTDGENVSYDDEPPGDTAFDQLSSEEKREIRQNFDEAGHDINTELYEEGETVPLEDRYEGEEIMYNSRNGWREYKITDLRLDLPGPDVIIENTYGSEESFTKEEYEKASNPVGSIPDYLTEDVGSVQEGKVVRIEGWEPVVPGPDSVEVTTIESVDGNLIQTRQGAFLADEEKGLMAEWDSVKEGDTYIHPEYGEITYTGDSGDRGYDDYEFQTEDSEMVYVQFSNDGEAIYRPVEMSLSEPDVLLNEFDEDRREEIESTVDGVLENHSLGVKQVLDDNEAYMRNENAIASYTPSTGDVMFNSRKLDEENIRKRYLKGYEDNFLAGDTIQHTVCHELAHALHAQEGDKPDTDKWQEYPDRPLIEEQLGEYAGSSPGELVAEVGALMLQGEDVESEMPEVYESYLEYGGVPQENITPI